MVVEGQDVDIGPPGDRFQLAEPLGLERLNEDQALDPVDIEPAGLGHVELVGVEAVELANVPVQGPERATTAPG